VALDFLYFLSDHNWIIFSYLILSQLFIVKFAIVLVRIAMLPTVKTAASTIEAC